MAFAIMLCGVVSCDDQDSARPTGRVGLSRAATGEVVLQVHVCEGTVSVVTLVDYSGDPVLRWTAEAAQSGYLVFDPNKPPAGWSSSASAQIELNDPDGYQLLAGEMGEQGLSGRFSPSDLALLDDSGSDVVRSHVPAAEIVTPARFAREC